MRSWSLSCRCRCSSSCSIISLLNSLHSMGPRYCFHVLVLQWQFFFIPNLLRAPALAHLQKTTRVAPRSANPTQLVLQVSVLLSLLLSLRAQGHRTLIFSQSRVMLDLIQVRALSFLFDFFSSGTPMTLLCRLFWLTPALRQERCACRLGKLTCRRSSA